MAERKTHADEANRILSEVGASITSAPPADGVTAALVAVGHALLAINSEVTMLRNELSLRAITDRGRSV
jgi:hypothetical protein